MKRKAQQLNSAQIDLIIAALNDALLTVDDLKDQIIPCPFCPSDAEVLFHEYDNGGGYWFVQCKGELHHNLDYCAKTIKEAVDVWNQRA